MIDFIIKSNMKAFSTAAGALGIRVVEDELAFDLIVNEVHLGPDDKEQGLLVNDDSDPPLLDHFVELADALPRDIVHDVRVPVASSPSHVDFNSISFRLGIIPVPHQLIDPVCCLLGLIISTSALTMRRACFFCLACFN